MRPDETCNGCPMSYKKEEVWACKLVDIIIRLKAGNFSRQTILEHLSLLPELPTLDPVLFLEWFWYNCISLEEIVTFSVYSEGCIKCGECCKGIEYQIPGLFEIREDPKTKKAGYMCRHLGYHRQLDNNKNDLGWRCGLYGRSERPKLCVDFPTGRENECLKSWLNELGVVTALRLSAGTAQWMVKTVGCK